MIDRTKLTFKNHLFLRLQINTLCLEKQIIHAYISTYRQTDRQIRSRFQVIHIFLQQYIRNTYFAAGATDCYHSPSLVISFTLFTKFYFTGQFQRLFLLSINYTLVFCICVCVVLFSDPCDLRDSLIIQCRFSLNLLLWLLHGHFRPLWKEHY